MQASHPQDSLREETRRPRPTHGSAASASERELRGGLPGLTFGEALARHWILILALTVVGALAGVAIAFSRTPVYTSESELNAGSLDASAQAIPGYTLAAQTLAEAYARVVETTQIQAAVAKRTGASVGDVAASVTAANIPGEPVFRIDGSGSSAAAAEALATAATRAIIRYARAQTSPPGASGALGTYKRETVLGTQLSSRVGQLKSKYGPNPTAAQQAQISAVQQSAAAAQLQANAAEQQYVNAITSQSSAGSVILLSPASPATNNRKQSLEIGGFAGALVGCLLGCVAAVRLAARRRRQVMQTLLFD